MKTECKNPMLEGNVLDHYGTTVYTFNQPFEAIDTHTGKTVEVHSVVDNNRGGASRAAQDSGEFQWFSVRGRKQKKNGEFFGMFNTLQVEGLQEVYRLIATYNDLRKQLKNN